jgi:peptidoglycan LD-endopeptidase CwlK
MVHKPERLSNVDPRLVDLVLAVGRMREVLVLEGARSVEDEQRAIESGHSALHNPMDSKHVVSPDRPLALAVDLAPVPLVWTDLAAFDGLADDVKTAAQALGTKIVWGGDWEHFKDRPHYQLVG